MLTRLLPSAADFTYRGSRLALWLFGFILFLKLAIAFGAIFNGHGAATVADGIPIDTYTPPGVQTVLALFGALGVTQILIYLLGALVLFKYQALVPAFALLLILEYVARKGITAAIPLVRSGGSVGGVVNWAIFGLMVLTFVLSVRQGQSSDRG